MGEAQVAGTEAAITLADHVRNLLLASMTSGRLRPGDRINEAELARRLGISRNPVREAVSGLAQRGFLVALPRRGHALRGFSRGDVDDVFSFRSCVETFALRQAMPRLTPADVAGLEAILAGMVRDAEAGRVAEVRLGDLALHRRLCALSGNRQTLRAYEGIETEISMLVASVDLERESLMETALIHLPVVEAIRAGDVEASVAAMQAHIAAAWDDVLATFVADAAPARAGRPAPRGLRRR